MSDAIRPRVLFVCTRNSARSQIAEALLRTSCPSDFEVESAGLEAGDLNPLAVATLQEVGIDISAKSTQGVFDVFKSGKLFGYVITVCDEAGADACPIFPGIVKRLHWNIPDPAALTGSWDERLAAVRPIRELIRQKVEAFCAETCPR